MKNKYIIITIIVVVLGLLVGGYLLDIGGIKTKIENRIDQQRKVAQPELDQKMTNVLKQEKEVKFGYVYVHPEIIFVPIIAKEGVSKEEAEKLAAKYAEILQKKYKKREINIQIVNIKGEKIASKIIPKK